MMNERQYHFSILVLDVVFFLFFVVAVLHLTQKATLPIDASARFPLVLNDVRIAEREQLEFFTGPYQIGDSVLVRSENAGGPSSAYWVRLVPYYPVSSVVLGGAIALIIFLLGLFVYIFRPSQLDAIVFHLASTATAMAVLAVKTLCMFNPPWIGYPAALMFFCAQGLVPVLFVHFTFIFPKVRILLYRKFLPVLYTFGCALGFLHLGLYLRAVREHSLPFFVQMQSVSFIEDGFIFLVLLAGILNFVNSYVSAETRDERKKLRWILGGLCLGPTPFIFFWFLPQALGNTPTGSEAALKIFLLLIPAAFAISILKYKLLNIDFLINRGAVYVLVIGVLLSVYAILIGGVASIIETRVTFPNAIPFSVAAVIIALLFEPLRRFVQRFVDRYFFLVEYNFRVVQRTLTEEIAQCFNSQEIGIRIVDRMDALLPVEQIGVFTLDERPPRLHLLAHKNFDLLESHGVRFESDKLRSSLSLPVALPDILEPGIQHEPADVAVFSRWGIVLVLPMRTRHGDVLGFLVLGKKKSGLRFTEEDVDLLNAIVVQAGFAIERLTLQEKVLLEHAEAQRLQELSDLKSYFVSSVSHDMRTPLTSIKMFAELLQSKQRPAEEMKEYLQIIEGEADRLTRLINNVLNFSNIERGIKEYHFSDTDLNSLAQSALVSMQYQLAIVGFTVHTDFFSTKLRVRADTDAITEAILNILSNAIKYSADRKEIEIQTMMDNGFGCVRISDKGIGIAENNLRQIFEPFYRASREEATAVGGAGLGLAIVRSTMDAHSGSVHVESSPGEGSTFTLLFPLSTD